MPDRSFLFWPFFDEAHRDRAVWIENFAGAHAERLSDEEDVDGSCRALVTALGDSGLLRLIETLDVRSLCLAREILARHSGLADFAFAMQGLGTGPITLYGTDEQKTRWIPPAAAGRSIAAFALSEPEAGSDVAALATKAVRDGASWRIDGEKMWISNGGIADHYVVFARSGEGPGVKGLSAFMVPADAPGLEIAERIVTTAPHPLARLRFEGCRVGPDALIGRAGEGFKIAMATLDVFRSTVGAAALGFARRAMDETLSHVAKRELFGSPLSDLQMTQARLADMATEIDAAALLIYRAAWMKDSGAARITREASMAKMHATEMAQRVVDSAVQLRGGRGVTKGDPVERLYREVRALRIYEGATEVHKVIIARQTLAAFEEAAKNL